MTIPKEPLTLPIVVDADWLCILGVNLADAAQEYHDSITFGTREEWIVWDFLKSAADRLYSAGVYLDAANIKKESQ